MSRRATMHVGMAKSILSHRGSCVSQVEPSSHLYVSPRVSLTLLSDLLYTNSIERFIAAERIARCSRLTTPRRFDLTRVFDEVAPLPFSPHELYCINCVAQLMQKKMADYAQRQPTPVISLAIDRVAWV